MIRYVVRRSTSKVLESASDSPNPAFGRVPYNRALSGSSSAGVQKSSAGIEILYMLSGYVYTSNKVLSIYVLPLLRSEYILSI